MKMCSNSAKCPYRDKNNPRYCGYKEHMTEYDVCPKIKLNILWLLEQQKKNKEKLDIL